MNDDGDARESPGSSSTDVGDVTAAAQLACLLEACAPKPGNVSPGRHFADTRFEAFLASAAAIGVPLSGLDGCRIGATVRRAVEATRRWTRSNTNLGIVLLLTPLAYAARACAHSASEADRRSGAAVASLDGSTRGTGAAQAGIVDRTGLREALRRILQEATVEDARDVYAAIRLAGPGGLGRSETQDVRDEPTLPLQQVMRLASARDRIAHEYATAFAVTFEEGAPALDRARQDGLDWNDAIVETFLLLLSSHPDSHIARRSGLAAAEAVSRRAADALSRGGVRTGEGRRTIDDLDRTLRESRDGGNPGTTADLTASAIYVTLLSGGWTPA